MSRPIYPDDEIITLLSSNGEEIDFIEIAGIVYNEKQYAVLQPVELLPGMSDDEALVFHVTKDEIGKDNFALEHDDDIINGVFEEYEKMLADLEKDEDE